MCYNLIIMKLLTQLRPLINFIVDILFILLLFYFIDSEYIKAPSQHIEISDTGITPPDAKWAYVLLSTIALGIAWFYFSSPAPDLISALNQSLELNNKLLETNNRLLHDSIFNSTVVGLNDN